MAEDFEKTEQATPKHRGEARKRGMVARSMEISSAAIVVAGLVSLAWVGPIIGHGLIDFTRQMFSILRFAGNEIPYPAGFFTSSSTLVLGATALWLGALLGAALIAGFGQVGFDFADGALAPKWSNLNPLTGLKRLFSWSSVIRALVAVLKIVIIAFACKGTVQEALKSELFHRAASPRELVMFLVDTTFALGWNVALAMVVIAVADYFYQHWNHEKSLKMSKEEVKEEGKQSEPNPQMRGKVRGKMRQFVLQRLKNVKPMLQEVPQATVVITNPIHVAVALSYDRSKMKAPRVVAKGLRLVAARIRECARTHNVPVLENKTLARGLYRHCPLGGEISPAYYQAVAMVLAQVYRLAAKKGMEQPPPSSPGVHSHGRNGSTLNQPAAITTAPVKTRSIEVRS